ncbi:MAG: glycosyltransferase family 2 protein [Gemella haemolysans]|uniref:glycosyltransferase family 2 protein n=1 Tax=Gemella haemolysans TaxID=1379 RepID=UPI003FA01125
MISIIVPIYNVEEYLEDCLNSILSQTYNDYEVIMVNDGTTDNSVKIAERYTSKDRRFTLINQENKGLSGARNTALKYSKGEYICFLDSDDKLCDTFLEVCMKNMADDVDIVETGRHYITGASRGDNIEYIEKYNESEEVDVITSKNILFEKLGKGDIYNSVFPRVVRRTLIDDDFFPEGLIFEDLATTPIMLDNVRKFVKINKALFLYRVRENSITTNKFSVKSLDIFKVCDIVEDYFLKNKNDMILNSIYLLLFRNITFQYKLYITSKHEYRWKYEEYLDKYVIFLKEYSYLDLNLYRMSPKYFYYLLKMNMFRKKIMKKIRGY